jgi:ATP-dependent Clp protease, protease subunit
MSLIPYVIQKTEAGERAMDIYSRLLDDRIIMLNSEFENGMASNIVAQLLYLQSVDPKKDITMYINSPGGDISAMWSIVDTMNIIKNDVSTVCTGIAASAGSVVLANGAKGKRFILPHSRVMIHQPLGGTRGQVTDIEIQVKELLIAKKEILEFFVNTTKTDVETLRADMERDYWLNAQQAVDYGIVDAILTR